MNRSKIFKKLKLRKFNCSDYGVVGIVVAVLLIGLLVSVVSLIQYSYVPKWMEEKEAEHMDTVLNQFSQLKFAIDSQSASNQINTPIATSITLGSKELPYLMSMRSYGRLEIISNDCSITVDNATGVVIGPINLGIIKYTSANAYYIPEEKQAYVYEAGSIITSQTKGNSISIKPSFKPDKNLDSIIFSVGNITGAGEKISYGGYDTVPIQTEFLITNNITNSTSPFKDAINISINTSYPVAWYVFLNSSLKAGGYEYGDTNDYNISSTDNNVKIEFKPNSDYPDIELNLIEILGQIGPGWVE
jgi:hypothetical protein